MGASDQLGCSQAATGWIDVTRCASTLYPLIKLARDGRREDFMFLAGSAGIEDANGLWQRLRRLGLK